MKIYSNSRGMRDTLSVLSELIDRDVWIKVRVSGINVQANCYIKVLKINMQYREILCNRILIIDIENHIVDDDEFSDFKYWYSIDRVNILYPIDTLTTDELIEIVTSNEDSV